MKNLFFYIVLSLFVFPIKAADTLTVSLITEFAVHNVNYNLKTFDLTKQKTIFQNELDPRLNFSPGLHPILTIKTAYKIISFSASLTVPNVFLAKGPFQGRATLMNKDQTKRTYLYGDWLHYSSSEKEHQFSYSFYGSSYKFNLHISKNMTPFLYYASSNYYINEYKGNLASPDYFDTLEIAGIESHPSAFGGGVFLHKYFRGLEIFTGLQYGKVFSAKTEFSTHLVDLNKSSLYTGKEFGLNACISKGKLFIAYKYMRYISNREKFTISSQFFSVGFNWEIMKFPIKFSDL